MKSGIHPTYQKVLFVDGATGDEWVSYSTMGSSEKRNHKGQDLPVIRLEISAHRPPGMPSDARACRAASAKRGARAHSRGRA